MADPRLAPKPSAEWDDDTRALIGSRSLNIFATLAHHPKLMKRWMVFGNHVLAKSTLSARDRELLILRTGWNCRAPYEWGQHVAIARSVGITDEEVARCAAGPDAPGWDPFEALLLRAADELHNDQSLTDATYAALARALRRAASARPRVHRRPVPPGVDGVELPARATRRRRHGRADARARLTTPS